jgi:hypothetical protein
MFRGFDTYLISRVDRAKGDHYYFDMGALRMFDAFGGASFALPARLDRSRRFHAMVESVRNHDGTRHYRPTVVLFTPDVENGGETVEIFHPYDEEIATAPLSGATATRRLKTYAQLVRQLIEGGADVDAAAHRAHGYTLPAI